jgi:hypothetical protein
MIYPQSDPAHQQTKQDLGIEYRYGSPQHYALERKFVKAISRIERILNVPHHKRAFFTSSLHSR